MQAKQHIEKPMNKQQTQQNTFFKESLPPLLSHTIAGGSSKHQEILKESSCFKGNWWVSERGGGPPFSLILFLFFVCFECFHWSGLVLRFSKGFLRFPFGILKYPCLFIGLVLELLWLVFLMPWSVWYWTYWFSLCFLYLCVGFIGFPSFLIICQLRFRRRKSG